MPVTDVVEHLLRLRAATLGDRVVRGAGPRGHVTEAEVREMLAGDAPDVPEELRRNLASARATWERRPSRALARLGDALDLDADERLLLATLATLGRRPVLHQVALSLAGDPVVDGVTALSLAELVAAGDDRRSRALVASMLPGGRLFRWRLLEGRGGPLRTARGPVRLDPAVERWLVGEDGAAVWSDASGPGLLRSTPEEGLDLPADEDALERIETALELAKDRGGERPRLSVVGPDPRVLGEMVERAVTEGGEPVLRVEAARLAFPEAATRVLRDARVHGAVLHVVGEGPEVGSAAEGEPAALAALADHPGGVVFTTREPPSALWGRLDDLAQVRIGAIAREQQVEAMTRALGGSPDARRVAEEVVPRFALDQAIIEGAAADVRGLAGDEPPTVAHLSTAIRRQLESRIGDFADAVSVTGNMEDLELPEGAREELDELVAACRSRDRILDEWGFGKRIPNARAVTALLYGPPGTGKTMAAGLVARELGTEVYKVDLSRVVDKYIGETEKHLSRIFDEAERGQVVLLFDEADSLFAKRTDVKKSTDRYANLEVNFLLQRVERHDGVVLLTTNNDQLIDSAFKRRIRYRIHFPMPGPGERARIWQRLLPADAPVDEDLDFEWLGEDYEMSGGHIRNAVLRAAYMAADAGHGLTTDVLVRAANVEYRALGKLVREDAEDED
ncbi:MAG: ATP-binding protein [Myxococcota bacterium]